MKRLVFNIALVALLISWLVPVSASGSNTVVPGRIWWYHTSTSFWEPEVGSWWHTYSVGIILDDSANMEDGWVAAYAVDEEYNRIFDDWLALLKEEEGKVWVIPNLHLPTIEQTQTEPEYLILYFLGYGNGRRCKPEGYLGIGEWVWTLDVANTPYLLYDFNYEVGDCYEWPWSAMRIWNDAGEEIWNEWKNYEQAGFFVKEVYEKETDGVVSRNYDVVQIDLGKSLENPGSYCGSGTIREGVGMTDGMFIGIGELCSGFWIAPASPTEIDRPSGFQSLRLPLPPSLECVRDADGSCIYGDPLFDPAEVRGVEVSTPETHGTYDLQGRRVERPERGLYIRGGKKVLVR